MEMQLLFCTQVMLFKFEKQEITKANVPDIGNLIVLLFFAQIDINPKIIFKILDEFFIRQMFWMLEKNETKIDYKIEFWKTYVANEMMLK